MDIQSVHNGISETIRMYECFSYVPFLFEKRKSGNVATSTSERIRVGLKTNQIPNLNFKIEKCRKSDLTRLKLHCSHYFTKSKLFDKRNCENGIVY